LELPADATAREVAEEAIELVEQCSRDVPDPELVAHDLADVVLAAAVIASRFGSTVVEAIEARIAIDTGREHARPE